MTTDPSDRRIGLTVTAADAGQRLDRFIADRLDGVSRARVQALLRAGHVDGPAGTIRDGGHRVKPAEVFTIFMPPPEPPEPDAEVIALDIVHEDDHVIVIDKPAGLVVHPAAGRRSGTLVNALIAHCGETLSGIGGVRRPGIVHRLDKDTSGLLVVAKTDAAHHGLAEQFASHGADGRLKRAYLALCWGVPDRPRGTISARLGRSSKNRTRIAVVKGEAGRHAVTHYETVETFRGRRGEAVASLLRLTLETGRTHQIRVHLAHSGHPVIGDPIYAAGHRASVSKLLAQPRAAAEALARQALHACELGFAHPVTGKHLRFLSKVPADMSRLLDALRRQAAGAKAESARRGGTSRPSTR